MAYYIFTRACRAYIIEYLRSHLSEEKQHYDGKRWNTLPAVMVTDIRDMRSRTLPRVTVMNSPGNTTPLSFDQSLGYIKDEEGTYGEVNRVYEVIGGRSEFRVTMLIEAEDDELQQKLTDIVAMYLLVGKDVLFRDSQTMLVDNIVFNGEQRLQYTDQTAVFAGSLTARVSADWSIIIPKELIERVSLNVTIVEKI